MLCLHEPHPQLVKESASFRYGDLPLEQVVDLLRRTRPPELEGRRYGETNNRLALLIPAIRAAFPSAQLLWLLRDGRGFTASEMQRGAYQEPMSSLPWRRSKWDRWRLSGAAGGVVDPSQWAAWTPFEKICWQWGHVNRLIRADLAELGPEQVRVLRIEDIHHELPALCEWLDIRCVQFHVPRSNARREVAPELRASARHPNAVARVTSWEAWSPEQRQVFERHAADVMDEHYQGWRDTDGTWQQLPDTRPAPAEEGSDEDKVALLRYELARAMVERHELRSELDELKRNPGLLLTHAGLTIRDRLRKDG
jgi:hypothetical protein